MRLRYELSWAAGACLLCVGCASGPNNEVRRGDPASTTLDGPSGIEWVAIDAQSIGGPPFHMSRHEITHAQYQAFVDDTGYDGRDHPSSKPRERFLGQWTDGRPPEGRANHPVCNVNWHHATAFCEWLSRKSGRPVRLPTDAEWELAAGGSEKRAYPWGDTWDPRACNWGEGGRIDGYAESAPVGSFARGATKEGLLDMAGNIWEWTADKTLRGGPWCERVEWQRCDFVAREDASRADDKFGFRVLMGSN